MNVRRILLVALGWCVAAAFAFVQPIGEWVHIAESGNARHFVMPSQARLSPDALLTSGSGQVLLWQLPQWLGAPRCLDAV